MRDQLAARGIKVHGTDSKVDPQPATTVEKWITDQPFDYVPNTDPTTTPERFATQLTIRWPLSIVTADNLVVTEYMEPGLEGGSCSGTLVGSDAVLTAAHCVIDWLVAGHDKVTGEAVRARARAYNTLASPRRNGVGDPDHDAPHDVHTVEKGFWRFSDWPAAVPDSGYEQNVAGEHDFAIVRLKSSPAIQFTAVRGIGQPPEGKDIVAAHYPYAFARQFRMTSSSGTLADLFNPLFDNVYSTNLSSEPGSSGGGVFESVAGVTLDGAVGVIVQQEEGQTSPGQTYQGFLNQGFPNAVLLFTPDALTDINGWISASL